MPESPTPIRKPAASRQEFGNDTWLLQYYTKSKTVSGHGEVSGPPPQRAGELLSATGTDKYHLTGAVGVGGMKIIRRAHDRYADRDVAFATMHAALPSHGQERRFLREARITAALEHPNIVPVHEIGLDAEGQPYFTMKLLGGENLHSILKQLHTRSAAYVRQYPLDRRLEIFLNTCQAVAFAHSRGILHLDLKPANIQVGNFGEVLVLDWGLARLFEDASTAGAPLHLPAFLHDPPTEGLVAGTPGFMAPEQERGQVHAFDARMDVFALGAVLNALVDDMPDCRRVPPALRAVVAKAMATPPQARYGSVQLLADDVRAFLGGYPVSAQNVGIGTLFWLLLKRHRALSVVVLTSLVTLLALLTVFVVTLARSERRAVDALARLEAEQAEKARVENRELQALTRLAAEQTEKARLGLLAAPQLLRIAQNLIRQEGYDDALANLNLCLGLDSSLTDAWACKGYLLLGRLEFGAAMDALDRVPSLARRPKPDDNPRPAELTERYLALAPAGSSSNYGQLAVFLRELVKKNRKGANLFPADVQEQILGQFFAQLNRTRPVTNEHLEFLGEALTLLNPPGDPVEYSYQHDAAGLAIALHGKRVTQLLPLTGLAVTALDLSGSAVEELRWVRSCGLQRLDLSSRPSRGGCRVRDLTPLFEAPLTELRLVNCPGIRLEQLRSLARLTQVTVAKGQVAAAQKVLASRNPPPLVTGE